jgi:hypothetical protein
MKKILGLSLLIALCGCSGNPTTSNPTITQTLTLTMATTIPTLSASGTFTDITTSTSTAFTINNVNVPSNVPYQGSFNFQTGKHDTVDFKITFNTPNCSFSYSLGSAQSSATADSNGDYTSSEITF